MKKIILLILLLLYIVAMYLVHSVLPEGGIKEERQNLYLRDTIKSDL